MSKKIGYARVSTDDQHLHLQNDALKKAGCSVIYSESISGKNTKRTELAQCLKALREGDTLVVWRLDRLGRSLSDLIKIITKLESRGVMFESLSEKIETNSATGRLVFHLMAALAEFERNLIRERTQAGLAAARARGRVGGRPRKLDQNQIKEIQQLMRDPDIPIMRIAERYGVSRATIYNVVSQNPTIVIEETPNYLKGEK